MPRSAELPSQKHGISAGNVGFLEYFVVCHVIWPLDAHDETKAPLEETFLKLCFFTVQNAGFTSVKESGDNYSFVDQDLCWQAQRVAFPNTLLQAPKRDVRFLRKV